MEVAKSSSDSALPAWVERSLKITPSKWTKGRSGKVMGLIEGNRPGPREDAALEGIRQVPIHSLLEREVNAGSIAGHRGLGNRKLGPTQAAILRRVPTADSSLSLSYSVQVAAGAGRTPRR